MARGYALAAGLLTTCAALLAPIPRPHNTKLHSTSVKEMSDMMREQRKLMEEEAIRLDMLALEDEQDAATLRGSQAGTQDDGTLATGEDDMTMDDESIMSGGGGLGGPAGILDKGMVAQKSRK